MPDSEAPGPGRLLSPSEAEALRDTILDDAGQTPAIVLIDGRSGSGKSTLAAELSAVWPDLQLVRLDDVYPGWDGLEAASRQVVDHMLAPHDPGWRRWDWAHDAPADWVPLDPARPRAIEGVGALTRASSALATFTIWVELDDVTRKRRALERDGDTYVPHWDRWAAHEERFIARENPRSLADLVITERNSA